MSKLSVDSGHKRDDAPLVLIVDDDLDFVRYVTAVVQAGGYRTSSAADGQTGLAIAEKYRPNVVLLDLNIPDIDGYHICEEIKSRLVTADIPIIFVTGADRTDAVVEQCFAIGGNDFISKPVNKVDLLARLRVVLREQSLREAYRRLALEDPFTTLANRRQLFMYISEAVITARRLRGEAEHESTGGPSESILIIADIDNLRAANDQYGYDMGDELILTLARLMKRMTGPDCRAGRLGGDEMALVLKRSSQAAAITLAGRLRQTFASIAFDAATSPKHFTASFGLASFDGQDQDFDGDDLLRQADIALFAAKQLGRSRTMAYWQLDPNNLPQVTSGKHHARSKNRERTDRAYVGQQPDPAPNQPAVSTTSPE